MKYIFYAYCIGFSLLVLTVLGELLACNLPETNLFTKWWRAHIIGIAPKDIDI
jgi:hypothetical protein